MATVNIGNLTFTHRGDYAGGTAYAKNDVVYYATNGNAYIAKQATTGNVPTNATYWSQFAQGSGGIWSGALSLGSASQSLRVNSGGNALEFYTPTAGGLIQRVETENTSISRSGTDGSWVDITASAVTITPNSTSNRIILRFQTMVGADSGSTGLHFAFKRAISGGATTNLVGNITKEDGAAIRCLMSAGEEFVTNSSQQFFGSNMSYEYIDHPNTTSAVTYTPIWYNGHATSNISIGAVYYQGSLNDEYPQVSIRTTALEIGV